MIYSIYNVIFSHLEYIILKKFVYLHREFEIKTLVKDQRVHTLVLCTEYLFRIRGHIQAIMTKLNYFYIKKVFAFTTILSPQNAPIHTNGSDKQLSDAIEAKVKGCSCVIILAGVYATYSKWINKEIEMAQKYRKPIIAVQPWGAERTSSVVKNVADVIVGWNAKSVANAVREYAIYQYL